MSINLNDDLFDLCSLPPFYEEGKAESLPQNRTGQVANEVLQKLATLTSDIPKDQFEAERIPLTRRIIKALLSQEVEFWKNRETLAEVITAFLNSVPSKEREQYCAKSLSADQLDSLCKTVSDVHGLVLKSALALDDSIKAKELAARTNKKKRIALQFAEEQESLKKRKADVTATLQVTELFTILLTHAKLSLEESQQQAKQKELIGKIAELDPSLLHNLSDSLKLDQGASMRKEIEAFINNKKTNITAEKREGAEKK